MLLVWLARWLTVRPRCVCNNRPHAAGVTGYWLGGWRRDGTDDTDARGRRLDGGWRRRRWGVLRGRRGRRRRRLGVRAGRSAAACPAVRRRRPAPRPRPAGLTAGAAPAGRRHTHCPPVRRRRLRLRPRLRHRLDAVPAFVPTDLRMWGCPPFPGTRAPSKTFIADICPQS